MADWFNHGFNNNYWNPIDFILPGTSAITTFANEQFDMNGQKAAQGQYASQLALNQQAQAFNAQEAQKQREFEEHMSSTAIQRQAADLKAAGLNPYLAISSMSGAATPTGSSASSTSGSADMANNKIAAAAGILAVVLRALFTKH